VTGPARPPPEVLAAFSYLAVGGNWEAGTVDRAGRRWVHRPWQGWTPAGPPPAGPSTVYTSVDVRRRRRRTRAARWAAIPCLAAAVALVCRGLTDMVLWYALAGFGLAAVVVALIRAEVSDGRPR
jgi:hypothetical protein